MVRFRRGRSSGDRAPALGKTVIVIRSKLRSSHPSSRIARGAGPLPIVLLALALFGCQAGPKGDSQSMDPDRVGLDFKVRPLTKPTISARATQRSQTPEAIRHDPCLGPAAGEMKLGLHRYDTVEALIKVLPGEFLVPDPATLPAVAEFSEAYFNSAMDGEFRQSTMGMTWFTGPEVERSDPTNPEGPTRKYRPELSIAQFTGSAIPDPPLEPSQWLNLRGTTAYGFNPPFEKGLHSITWKEGCRNISIIAPLPAADLVAIAKGLRIGQP